MTDGTASGDMDHVSHISYDCPECGWSAVTAIVDTAEAVDSCNGCGQELEIVAQVDRRNNRSVDTATDQEDSS